MDINEEQIAFYSEIGHAITQRAYVEFALAWIVATRFEKKNTQNAIDGFLSIENMRAKLQYADTILNSPGLSKEHRADWATLHGRTGKHATKRNRLAHSWMKIDLDRPAGRRIMLLPTRPDYKPTRQKYPNALCLRDIVSYQLEFFALSTALENFSDRLLGQEEQSPKSQEQPQRPPTIAQIRRQIYAYARRPPRPSRT